MGVLQHLPFAVRVLDRERVGAAQHREIVARRAGAVVEADAQAARLVPAPGGPRMEAGRGLADARGQGQRGVETVAGLARALQHQHRAGPGAGEGGGVRRPRHLAAREQRQVEEDGERAAGSASAAPAPAARDGPVNGSYTEGIGGERLDPPRGRVVDAGEPEAPDAPAGIQKNLVRGIEGERGGRKREARALAHRPGIHQQALADADGLALVEHQRQAGGGDAVGAAGEPPRLGDGLAVIGIGVDIDDARRGRQGRSPARARARSRSPARARRAPGRSRRRRTDRAARA